jgi:hypothetical protein
MDTFTFKVSDGELESPPATVTINIQSQPVIHIGAITMSKQRESWFNNKWRALATVTIVDDQNHPVSNASVSGIYWGAVSVSVAGYTNASGQVTLASLWKGGGGTFNFAVNGVWKANCVYDSTKNVVTSASIKAP